MQKPWGMQHIIYLLLCAIILIPLAIILKKKLKTDKQIETMFKILGVFGLIAVICARISYALEENNFLYLIPNSFCALTSFFLSISLIFLKKDNLILHTVWLIGLTGMTTSVLYPDFIAKTTNILYFGPITGLLHHTISLFNLILIFVFKYVTLTYKKSWTQLIGGAFYIGLGLILIYACGIKDSFYILVPAIKNTNLYFAAMLPIYVFVYILVIFLVEFIRYKKNKNDNLNTEIETKPEQKE